MVEDQSYISVVILNYFLDTYTTFSNRKDVYVGFYKGLDIIYQFWDCRGYSDKACIFPLFVFTQITSKCNGAFKKAKHWNVAGINVLQFQKFKYFSLHMPKGFAWKFDVFHQNAWFLVFKFILDLPRHLPPPPPPDDTHSRPKLPFDQRNVATYIYKI